MNGNRTAFALPAVLVMTAVLSLVYLTAVQGLAGLHASALKAEAEVLAYREGLSLEARTAYLLATRPLDSSGISLVGSVSGTGTADTLQLDNRPYFGIGATKLFSVQDEAGLIDLDQLSGEAARRFFAKLSSPDLATTLTERFADYIDGDRLKRVHGAEREDYLLAGAPPPPDRPLRRVPELLGILGWRDVPEARWVGWRDLLTADPTGTSLNVNTAPAEVLEVLYGLSPAKAALAVESRAGAPFASLEALGRLAGVPLHGDAERSYTRPSGKVVLTGYGSGGLVWRSRILFTPDDEGSPLWMSDRAITSAGGETPHCVDACPLIWGAIFPQQSRFGLRP